MKNKKLKLVVIIFLGMFGVHKFIEKDKTMGWIYLFTCGLCGIGWIIDIIKCTIDIINEQDQSNNSNLNSIKVETNEYTNMFKTVDEKIEKSNNTLSFFDDEGRYLRYYYNDVEVKGVQYRDFDINKIKINHQLFFENEPDNKVDPNAIKILYDDIFIGYIPKNNLQEMMLDYYSSKDKQVCGFIHSVDRENKKILIGLGFYQEIDNRVEVIETKLVKTTKKSDIEDRQENLSLASNDMEVELQYDYDLETYLVLDNGLELGELNANVSKKLQSFEEERMSIKAGIINIEENDNLKYECTIKIIIK